MSVKEVGFSNTYGRHMFCNFQLSWPNIKWLCTLSSLLEKFFLFNEFCVKVNRLGILARTMWPNNNYNKNIFLNAPLAPPQKKPHYHRSISPSGILDYMKHLFR